MSSIKQRGGPLTGTVHIGSVNVIPDDKSGRKGPPPPTVCLPPRKPWWMLILPFLAVAVVVGYGYSLYAGTPIQPVVVSDTSAPVLVETASVPIAPVHSPAPPALELDDKQSQPSSSPVSGTPIPKSDTQDRSAETSTPPKDLPPRRRLDLRKIPEEVIPVHISRDHNWAFYAWLHNLRAGRLSPVGGYTVIHVDTHSDLFGYHLTGSLLRETGITQLTGSMHADDETKYGRDPANYIVFPSEDVRESGISTASFLYGYQNGSLGLSQESWDVSPLVGRAWMHTRGVRAATSIPVDSLSHDDIVLMSKSLTIANYIPAAIMLGADHNPSAFKSDTAPSPRILTELVDGVGSAKLVQPDPTAPPQGTYTTPRSEYVREAPPVSLKEVVNSKQVRGVLERGFFVDHVVWVRPDVKTEFNKPKYNGEYNITIGFAHLLARNVHPLQLEGWDGWELGELWAERPAVDADAVWSAVTVGEGMKQPANNTLYVQHHTYREQLAGVRAHMRSMLEQGQTLNPYFTPTGYRETPADVAAVDLNVTYYDPPVVSTLYTLMDWDLATQGPRGGMPPLNATLRDFASMSMTDGDLVSTIANSYLHMNKTLPFTQPEWAPAATINELISKIAVRFDGALCCTVDGAIDAAFCNDFHKWDRVARENEALVQGVLDGSVESFTVDMGSSVRASVDEEIEDPELLAAAQRPAGIGLNGSVVTPTSPAYHDKVFVDQLPTKAVHTHPDELTDAMNAIPIPSQMPFRYPFPSYVPGTSLDLSIYPHRDIRLSVVSPHEFLERAHSYGLGPTADADHPLNHPGTAPLGTLGATQPRPRKRVLLDLDLDFFASGSEWRNILHERKGLTSVHSVVPARWVDACCGRPNPFLRQTSGCCAVTPFRQLYMRALTQALVERILVDKAELDRHDAQVELDETMRELNATLTIGSAEWQAQANEAKAKFDTRIVEVDASIDQIRTVAEALMPEDEDVDTYVAESGSHLGLDAADIHPDAKNAHSRAHHQAEAYSRASQNALKVDWDQLRAAGVLDQCPELPDIIEAVAVDSANLSDNQAKVMMLDVFLPTDGELWGCETARPMLYSDATERADNEVRDVARELARRYEQLEEEHDAIAEQEGADGTDAEADGEGAFLEVAMNVTQRPVAPESLPAAKPSASHALQRVLDAIEASTRAQLRASQRAALRIPHAPAGAVDVDGMEVLFDGPVHTAQALNASYVDPVPAAVVLKSLARVREARRATQINTVRRPTIPVRPTRRQSRATPRRASQSPDAAPLTLNADSVHLGKKPMAVEASTRRRRDYGGRDRMGYIVRQRQEGAAGPLDGDDGDAVDEVASSDTNPDLFSNEFQQPQTADQATSIVATEKSQFASVLWNEMPASQRVREENASQSCFCSMIQYSEHLPLSTSLNDANHTADALHGPARMTSTADPAVNADGETCVPTHATAYLYRAAQWLNKMLRIVAPHTDVVTVARSDDYFLPPTLTADAEWLVLSALHNNGLGVSKQIKESPNGGKKRMVVKQYVQMEQFLEISPVPKHMCSRPMPFCVDWNLREDEICWQSQYQNEFVFNF